MATGIRARACVCVCVCVLVVGGRGGGGGGYASMQCNTKECKRHNVQSMWKSLGLMGWDVKRIGNLDLQSIRLCTIYECCN